MRPYRVEWTHRALKDLRGLGPEAQFQVRRRVEMLSGQPRPRGVEKLAARTDEYRLRVGAYRVIIEIHDEIVLVLVVRVQKRGDAYGRRLHD